MGPTPSSTSQTSSPGGPFLAALTSAGIATSPPTGVLGDAVGDQTVDTIVEALNVLHGRLMRTEIRDLFQRNVSSNKISAAFSHPDGRASDRDDRREDRRTPSRGLPPCLGPPTL